MRDPLVDTTQLFRKIFKWEIRFKLSFYFQLFLGDFV